MTAIVKALGQVHVNHKPVMYCRPKTKFDKLRKIIISPMKKDFSTPAVKIIYH